MNQTLINIFIVLCIAFVFALQLGLIKTNHQIFCSNENNKIYQYCN